MLTPADFRALLRRRGTLIIDGALATELEARGHDLNHPLWSGKLLRDDPDSIEQIHHDYYLAGADIAITASYQASTQGLSDHFGLKEDESIELIKRSVRLAQRARCQAYRTGSIAEDRKLLIAGSVGPYGAYLANGSEYRGDYQRSVEEFQIFHRPRIRALIDAGVDLLALETMPSSPEIEALVSLLNIEFADATAWVSCTLSNAKHLSDGSPTEAVLKLAFESEQVVAFGFNCYSSPDDALTRSISRQGPPVVLLCYANSGESWDAEQKTWRGGDASVKQGLSEEVCMWKAHGVRLMGGCCRTTPRDITVITQAIKGG
ncbi:hypothetical protein BAUCODRAFT_60756 [Baudoinia panamericana UAMH 10762]|uniref:Hcy-binding domain-containing protein n=1 Tax=Baudoinia panamericana (strain UAMH 10762) TaxID=717646 RepID=M2NA36_BAUPA|nr:uncharacterized protein BAUCODRAFT_60756 [Baudoinia panamericana UAMH 10762]EMD01074.1 hypothetical protein BAUCODRAFT_60756 [Baudoinia panamericana UAMH 10762]